MSYLSILHVDYDEDFRTTFSSLISYHRVIQTVRHSSKGFARVYEKSHDKAPETNLNVVLYN